MYIYILYTHHICIYQWWSRSKQFQAARISIPACQSGFWAPQLCTQRRLRDWPYSLQWFIIMFPETATTGVCISHFQTCPRSRMYVICIYIYSIIYNIYYIYIYILHILYIYTYIYIYPRKSQFSLIKSPQKSLQWHRKTPAWSRSVADNLVPNTSKSLWAPLHLGAGLRKCSH